ncbi:MAG: carbamoyltransferase C-terminal domain-containing protein [Myxococcota bacterium]|nr:carbamoyltransferase C-terminal domain-containing protein [Myxococcota bacterium]
MITLGIADNHDSGAALVRDGMPVAAVGQERIDRVKNSGSFPWGAIDAVLEIAQVSARDVDHLVIGTAFTPSTILRALPSAHAQARTRGSFSPLLHAYIVYQSALRAAKLEHIEINASRRLLKHRLSQRPFTRAELVLMDHHTAHAHAAYRTQDRSDCLVLTADAMGDGTSATAFLGRDGELDLLWRQSGLAAINTFYSRITEMLGFQPNRHEGKVMGLAAYATAPTELVGHLESLLYFRAPGFSQVPWWRNQGPSHPFWQRVSRWSREEIASAAQRVLEQAVTDFVRHWVLTSRCPHVALAGGIFANVRVNQLVGALDEVQSLWVYPHMGDGGLPLGAALGHARSEPRRLDSIFLGPRFDSRECFRALKMAQVARTKPEEDLEYVANLLAEGKTVARFSGAMEWGPRALGNRSVLCVPERAEIVQNLNKQLQRDEFMPFAPMVRAEDAHRWFQVAPETSRASRFMTTCLPCTGEFRSAFPAVVHVDGTARPQLVDREENPRLHALLTAVERSNGRGVLLNTSFNVHEEPIVCTPGDAIRAWKQAGLDALWMSPYVAVREER